ncbi:hypothetical protein [Nonomuraea turcica]|uniref:hypothetical protein n=1 Tax=Nonomuraea sp. G32 TaxID=3067274 RepID=UPI00273C89D5|nr:hypothetical protein [Nonomuraea sp. G32]MDP4511870.1 hypothetical protein [Nonomuraea sp. G32]
MEDELAKRRGPAVECRNLMSVEAHFDGFGRHRLSAAAAGEEPAGVLIGGGGQVETLVEVAEQQLGERLRDGDRRLAEAKADLAVAVADDELSLSRGSHG